MKRLLLLAFALAALRASGAADPRPNILFCLADDWSYGHAGVDGDRVVQTPAFDRIAREGVRFTHAFSAAPSCTASRAAILTGQYPHRLEGGANLWGPLPAKFKVYPDLLEKAGYVVGLTSKGWGPGDFEAGGFARNPAGPRFKNFEEFHQKFFALSFAKRPAEELYDVQRDPRDLRNLAGDPAFAAPKQKLRAALQPWMKDTADPRAANPADDRFDRYRFGGRPSEGGKSS